MPVAPGIGWVRLAMWGPLKHVNCWLLEDGDGHALVDTGFNREDSRAAWKTLAGGPLARGKVTRVIGTHMHLSGVLKSWGVPSTNGMKLAIEDINAAGGVNGRKLRLVNEDDGYDPKKAVLATQKLIELAAGSTKNLPGFKQMGDGNDDNLGGFPAYQLGGTWTQDGQERAVAEKVVVINGNDNIYLLELNADCLPDQVQQALPATVAIDEKTTITP